MAVIVAEMRGMMGRPSRHGDGRDWRPADQENGESQVYGQTGHSSVIGQL